MTEARRGSVNFDLEKGTRLVIFTSTEKRPFSKRRCALYRTVGMVTGAKTLRIDIFGASEERGGENESYVIPICDTHADAFGVR